MKRRAATLILAFLEGRSYPGGLLDGRFDYFRPAFEDEASIAGRLLKCLAWDKADRKRILEWGDDVRIDVSQRGGRLHLVDVPAIPPSLDEIECIAIGIGRGARDARVIEFDATSDIPDILGRLFDTIGRPDVEPATPQRVPR